MSSTIGTVSEALRGLLEANMSPATKVTVLSPMDPSGLATRINLFLYRIVRNAFLNNRDWLPKPGTIDQLIAPPLSLNLFYLVTPFAPLDALNGLSDAHDLLGEAMRVFYENPIVPQAFLNGVMQEGQVKVTLHSPDVEELSKLWTALTKDIKASAVYEVSYVDVPATAEAPLPVRVRTTGLQTNATTRFPQIASMQPISGPVGTAAVFSGINLQGWKITVVVGGQSAAKDQPAASDTAFSAAIPAALTPGLYEVSVDAAGISRFQSFFQVTP